MDKIAPSNGHVEPGISIRNGPVEEMDVDKPEEAQTNGLANGKRKARASLSNGKTYKEASDSEDDQPLVSSPRFPTCHCLLVICHLLYDLADISFSSRGVARHHTSRKRRKSLIRTTSLSLRGQLQGSLQRRAKLPLENLMIPMTFHLGRSLRRRRL